MRLKEAVKKLKLYITLLELHDANVFKIKQVGSFIYGLEQSEYGLKDLLSQAQKGEYKMSEKQQTLLWDLLETGTFPALAELLAETPKGVIEITQLPGLGSKKVKTLWKELDIASLESLEKACNKGEVALLKGFGKKTEEKIKEAIAYVLENKGKLLLSEAEMLDQSVKNEIHDYFPDLELALIGDLRRTLNTISCIDYAVKEEDRKKLFSFLSDHDLFEYNKKQSSPYTWKGRLMDVACDLQFTSYSKNQGLALFKKNSGEAYLNHYSDRLKKISAKTEKEVFEKLEIPFIPSSLREVENLDLIRSDHFKLEKIVKDTDIKGCLHNHSLYSDGQNTIKEMAEACQSLGLNYFGISDHSKTASYAGGLSEEDIVKQHLEVDALNAEMKDFYVFKGIESDILPNGNLDYDKDVLASFDFIVSSIHSNLTMKKEEATARLIKAIENPFTTILGHLTGRLLLRRKGYPIDHLKVIDACAANKVAIEINANPWRLDLDWKFVRKAVDKGIMIAINPDAHEVAGITDMQYGLKIAQKAGLYPEQIMNCMTLEDLKTYFVGKK